VIAFVHWQSLEIAAAAVCAATLMITAFWGMLQSGLRDRRRMVDTLEPLKQRPDDIEPNP
jgi:hypothetical protein